MKRAPTAAEVRAMSTDEFRSYALDGTHPTFIHERFAGAASGGTATPAAPPPAPLPESLDGLSTAAMIDLAKSNPAGFLSIAKPLLDRLSPSEMRTLRETNLPKFNAAFREKCEGAGSFTIQEEGVTEFTLAEVSEWSGPQAARFAKSSPKRFLAIVGAKVEEKSDPAVTAFLESAAKSREQKKEQRNAPINFADLRTPADHKAARERNPAGYLEAVRAAARADNSAGEN